MTGLLGVSQGAKVLKGQRLCERQLKQLASLGVVGVHVLIHSNG
jgi:hypothetical protein